VEEDQLDLALVAVSKRVSYLKNVGGARMDVRG